MTQVARASERRAFGNLDLPSWLVMAGERIRVDVVDISREGVRLQVPRPVPVGGEAELELGQSGYARVSIRWVKGGEAGGTFVNMI